MATTSGGEGSRQPISQETQRRRTLRDRLVRLVRSRNKLSKLFAALAVAASTALVGWAVTFFAPGVWESIKSIGGSDPPLEIIVLEADEFDSPMQVPAFDQRFIWPMAKSELPKSLDATTARQFDAAYAKHTAIRVVARGTGPDRVTIHRIEVDVVQKDLPLRGVWDVDPGSGGESPVRYLTAELDTETLTWSDGGGQAIGAKPVYVTHEEEENFDILATARNCDCRWIVVVTFTVPGEGPQTVSAGARDGRPFRTSSTQNAAALDIGRCTESPTKGPPLCDLPTP